MKLLHFFRWRTGGLHLQAMSACGRDRVLSSLCPVTSEVKLLMVVFMLSFFLKPEKYSY